MVIVIDLKESTYIVHTHHQSATTTMSQQEPNHHQQQPPVLVEAAGFERWEEKKDRGIALEKKGGLHGDAQDADRRRLSTVSEFNSWRRYRGESSFIVANLKRKKGEQEGSEGRSRATDFIVILLHKPHFPPMIFTYKPFALFIKSLRVVCITWERPCISSNYISGGDLLTQNSWTMRRKKKRSWMVFRFYLFFTRCTDLYSVGSNLFFLIFFIIDGLSCVVNQ